MPTSATPALKNAIGTTLTTARGAHKHAVVVPKNAEGWLDKKNTEPPSSFLSSGVCNSIEEQ
ncbi:hypothetical protein Ngar_c32430 [Candidatus Nitrososphaera gargensis Ga9.2]|uniref:Uncharacterized protein n=1 Tax=Nitrososphaera gargensis (strain Ga9.2) TaxID=1237085 RepID=K0INY0_NITGG|nr:hypothetical protein Ngar_c32430 [Candidatus Nitrososphaera gargensis Ga9.2]